MRLPKWVVKWIKDDFDLEKMELKVVQQDAEITSLRRKIAELRFYDLPENEIEWVERMMSILWISLFWRQRYIFLEEYMRLRDEDEKRKYLDMPF